MIELTGDRTIRAANIREEISGLSRSMDLRADEIGDLDDRIAGLESVQLRDEKRIEALEADLQRLEAEEADPESAAANDAIKAWRKAFSNPDQLKLPFAEVATP